ncbi:hypothetical protein [Rhodohalobacter sp. 8-1]|uniref:hypothetical protein n=1 Tax=Rhodohalobacter sp. 8-1 TaxID=3131972 RepID=UPI0030EC03BF
MKNPLVTQLVIILFASFAALGCNIINPESDSGRSEVQVQMQINTGSTSTAGQLMASQKLMSYEIQEVKLYIDEMELESVSDDSLDFEEEGFIVNLPLDGSPINISAQNILPGLYDEFELEVERPDDEEDTATLSDPDFRDGDRTYSVVVKGLYQGEEFTFKSWEDFEIEMELNPPLDVSESESTDLVINIDINSWFKDPSGNDLDPNVSNNFEQINENIENSFEGFEEEDDDEDDDDDDEDD